MQSRYGRQTSPLAAIVTGVAVCLAAAACASSTASSKGATESGAASADIAAAQKFLSHYEQNPTSVGMTTALPEAPPTGKSIIALTNTIPVSLYQAKAEEAAAQLLGWKFSEISNGATAATAVGAFDAALARKPSAILFGGFDPSIFRNEIAKAKAEGIALVSAATSNDQPPGVLADVGGVSTVSLDAKVLAAYFVVQSGGEGHAAVFNIAAFPILTAFVDSFTSSVKTWCQKCTTEVVNQQISDIGVNTPANVVATLQRNPAIKWAVFSNGDLAQGVSSAVKTAGLSGIKIVGEVPSQSDLAAIKSGDEDAWVGYPTAVQGWRIMDVVARYFTKAGLTFADATDAPLPAQLITAHNVNSIVVGSDRYYIGVAGYQNQFAKLWHVK